MFAFYYIFITMKNIGLYDTFWVYVLPTVVSPFYIVLCKTFVESIPKELTDAAEIDGAGTMRTFVCMCQDERRSG